MNADDLDQIIRDTQHHHADRIGGAGDPVPEIRARVQRARRKRRTLTVAVAVAAAGAGVVGALAGGAQLVRGDGPTDDTLATSTPAPTSPSPATPSAPASAAPRTRDDALRSQLAANPAVLTDLLGSAHPQGAVLCALHVFGSDPGNADLYVWIACGTYTTGPGARVMSAGGDPAVVSVRGTGAATEVVDVRFPRIAHLDQDIAAMFPAQIATLIQRRDFQTAPSASQLLDEARRLTTS